MLKIKDSSGEVVGVLKDEDSTPEMISKSQQKRIAIQQEAEEGEEDGDTDNVDV